MPAVKPTTMERRSSARVAASPYYQHQHHSSSTSSSSSSTLTSPSSTTTTSYISLPVAEAVHHVDVSVSLPTTTPATTNATTIATPISMPTSTVNCTTTSSDLNNLDNCNYQSNGHSGNASVTYAALIALAIELSDDKRLVLDDIYKFVEKHRGLVPVKSHPNWKNSVRHNLSLRPCFVKVPRYNSSGKAMSAWWTLDTSCLPKAAKEAVERARRFTDGPNQAQTTDQFIREVLTTEDQPCGSVIPTTASLSPAASVASSTSSSSPSAASSSSSSESQDYHTTDSVPDMYTNEVTPTPPYTLSSTNSFLFGDNGIFSATSEEEFATVPGHHLSPPHLYFPEPEESPFPDFQMAVYPSDFDSKFPRDAMFDLTLPSPFSKSSFAFNDLLFS